MAHDPAVEALVELAQQLDAGGRTAEAMLAYERALARDPSLTDSWYNLGRMRRLAGLAEPALAAYAQALARGVSGPEEVRLNRAVIYSDLLARPDDAERELEAALALAPDYVPALLNLGNLHEDRGRREAACATYERVLALEPGNADALARLANASRIASADDAVVARLRHALAAPALAAASRATLGYALGRALDEGRDYDAAWSAYADANRASFASRPPGTPPYDRAALERAIDRQIEVFSSPTALWRAEEREGAPLFICGMFRSGSTLAERVLAAHPRVTAGGELDWLPRLAATLAPFPEPLRRASPADLTRLADWYLGQRRATFPDADLLTDKRPDNFLYVGLIKTLFPRARIVHTLRSPLDNCLSAWFLHLDHSMAYATDLLDTAHYLRESRRLMAHWRALWPEDVLDFDYDAFVREPRPALTRLLAFCGLDWDERCLEFHRGAGAVRTASVWQVREPLYARSSGRWRHYARQLAPVREFLGPLAEGAR